MLKKNDKLEGILKDKEMKQYICKACHSNIVNLIMTHTYANSITQVIMTLELLLYPDV